MRPTHRSASTAVAATSLGSATGFRYSATIGNTSGTASATGELSTSHEPYEVMDAASVVTTSTSIHRASSGRSSSAKPASTDSIPTSGSVVASKRKGSKPGSHDSAAPASDGPTSAYVKWCPAAARSGNGKSECCAAAIRPA